MKGAFLGARRTPSVTSNFGTGRRESHDASAFYARFTSPVISSDDVVNAPRVVDEIVCGDARSMESVGDASVALVVTSPPYFAGKEYEEALGQGAVPGTYLDYLQMLLDVFAQCVRKLEPGGRIAVNVANLGRKPYRSLSTDVVEILQDRLGLLLRGEIVWQKARGASGSCAWGSWRSPANPVIRDLTERVIVASKGRFDRAPSRPKRARAGMPSEPSITTDEFLEATTDVWEIPAESATRVGHPAPFPVELPLRLIHLYTYRGDLVLDPFMGAGSTAVAAVRSSRHFIGFDTDPRYVAIARRRAASELARPQPDPVPERGAFEVAEELLRACGFADVAPDPRVPAGVEVAFAGRDRAGRRWYFDVSGGFTVVPGGLRRTDVLWRALGKASVIHAGDPESRVLLLTVELPEPGTAGDAALRAVRGRTFVDALELTAAETRARLELYAGGDRREPVGDLPGPPNGDRDV